MITMRVRCTVLAFMIIALLVLRLEIVPEYLGISDNLLQEPCIRGDRLVDLLQFCFVSQRSQQLLVCARKLVDIFPPAVIR